MNHNQSVKATILIADDEPANREILSELLEREGYHTVQAEDGAIALEMLRGKRVDLALLDVMMPGRTGYAVCHEAKSDPDTRLIPIVLVTGLNRSEDRIKGIEGGADDFLSKPVDRAELLARVRSLLRLKLFTDELESAETVLCSLAISIEAKDPYTVGHCDRLSVYAEAMGKRVGLNPELLIALRRGGIVHDLGKVAVPEHILRKPGPLTPEERKIMEEHPAAGERICAPLKSFRNVLPIIRHHHEKLDGSGYPDGLKGSAIPLTARILSAVDIYDALTTDRPYRKALSREQALHTMNEEVKRGWWDPDLVMELETVLDEPEAEELLRAAGTHR
ncbi:MAG TPA: HD domain-containing phosphohydrolase [Candidatus Acidoferrales bacterium]|nr:HD domain-containing phosphohydrolase [Candidatus Acidoferrales bacterium]